jgi:hypothetical protein
MKSDLFVLNYNLVKSALMPRYSNTKENPKMASAPTR